MMMGRLMHRNRFKSKPKPEKQRWQWPAFLRDWRLYARRVGLVLILVGALSALTWALDRPVRVISIDGSFQRVSLFSSLMSRMPESTTGWAQVGVSATL